jgi:amino acid efflux transporter
MSKHLSRSIDLLGLIVYYFSTIVGVGIFIVPLAAAKIAGPASIISWLLVFLFAYPFAMIFAHISQRYQVSGSIQKFLEDSWSPKFGKSMAIFLIVSAIFGNALLGFAAARYVIELTGTNINVYYLGVALLVLPTLFNLMSIGLSSKIQIFSLILLIILIECIVFSSTTSINLENLVPFAPNGLVEPVLAASVICFYSVVGWENVDAMAEEVKNPGATYHKAVKFAIIGIFLFYSSLVTTMLLVLNHAEISSTKTILIAILNHSVGAEAAAIGGVVAVFLLLLGANAWIFGTSRLIFALSRDNIFPKSLSKINKNQIPVYAVIVQLFIYFLLGSGFAELHINEDMVVEITSLNYLLLYTVIFFTGFKSFTTPRLKGLSAVAMLVTSFFLTQSVYGTSVISILILLMCFVYTYVFRKRAF